MRFILIIMFPGFIKKLNLNPTMLNYGWFYYCYEKGSENPLLLSCWKTYPNSNYSVSSYHPLFVNKLDNKINLTYLFSFQDTRLSFYNKGLDAKNALPVTSTDSYTYNNSFTPFLALRNSSFISFFIDNMIDVPVCFKKSSSLRYKSFEFPLLKFSNFLMKKGKREQTLRSLLRAFDLFFTVMKKTTFKGSVILRPWIDFIFFLNNNLLFKKKAIGYNLNTGFNLSYNNSVTKASKLVSSDFFIKNYLLSRLCQVSPVFSFFIYNVDKNVRKFSRGKSGKYVFVWKYIAFYKRLYVAMRWIVKDIKFNSSRSISERIEKILLRLTNEPSTTFAFKSYTFSHNYVFRNLKKTLMASLKTTI